MLRIIDRGWYVNAEGEVRKAKGKYVDDSNGRVEVKVMDETGSVELDSYIWYESLEELIYIFEKYDVSHFKVVLYDE